MYPVTSPVLALYVAALVFVGIMSSLAVESLIESIVALMLPYSAGFGVVSTIVFLLWVLLGLPLGPGAELYYTG